MSSMEVIHLSFSNLCILTTICCRSAAHESHLLVATPSSSIGTDLKITRFRHDGDVKNKKPSDISPERILGQGHEQERGSQGASALARV